MDARGFWTGMSWEDPRSSNYVNSNSILGRIPGIVKTSVGNIGPLTMSTVIQSWEGFLG